jgi:hypothetical protein|tara:strand:+ start:717 stop:1241 length:525 start_codon:yes stop_codon:yes gene_type:complete
MPITKKKKKKIIKSSTSKKQRRGLKNFDIGFIKNPYLEAAKVKDWNELEKFMSIHAAALGPAGVAYASVKFVMDNYDEMKICYECEDAVLDLIDATKIKGGAVKLFNDYQEGKKGPLADFILETQYAPPRTISTFQDHMTFFKDHFGLARKNTGAYKEKQKLEALERIRKKNLK